MKENNLKAIVLLSGGQDSTTCLYWCIEKFNQVLALSFNYGQYNINELECAKKICKRNNIKHIIIDLGFLSSYKGSNNCLNGRNLLFLSFATVIARYYCFDNIVIGVSKCDAQTYPDCKKSFIRSMNKSIGLALDSNINIYAPLLDLNKAEIWKMADDLNIIDVINNETVTCYNGEAKNGCGKCHACQLRMKGYENYKSLLKE